MSKRIALIIGNSEYDDPKFPALEKPKADAEGLANVLRNPEIGNFEVKVLLDEPQDSMYRSIARLFKRHSREDLLLLYFAGHGVRDEEGKLYLATKTTDPELLSGSAISANWITEQMNSSYSQRQILILDCCYSGAFARGARSAIGDTVGTIPAFMGDGFGKVILTATDAFQRAWEHGSIIGEVDNSVFTHYLINGLKTGAADLDQDGIITIDDWYHYTYEQVLKNAHIRQTPQKWAYGTEGKIIVASNPSWSRVSRLQAEQEEHERRRAEQARTERQKRISILLAQGEEALRANEWERATSNFESVLVEDATNRIAIQALKKIKRQQRLALKAEAVKQASFRFVNQHYRQILTVCILVLLIGSGGYGLNHLLQGITITTTSTIEASLTPDSEIAQVTTPTIGITIPLTFTITPKPTLQPSETPTLSRTPSRTPTRLPTHKPTETSSPSQTPTIPPIQPTITSVVVPTVSPANPLTTIGVFRLSTCGENRQCPNGYEITYPIGTTLDIGVSGTHYNPFSGIDGKAPFEVFGFTLYIPDGSSTFVSLDHQCQNLNCSGTYTYTFNNVGQYTFEIAHKDADGIWRTGATLYVVITP